MKRNMWLFALAACVAALPAGAGDWMVGGSAGQSTVEVDSAGFDESDTGFKLFGGWNAMTHLRVEGGYADLGGPSGSVDGVDAEADVSAWDAFATGVIPLGKWELFGKAGFVMWDADVRVSSGPFSVRESSDGTDIAYGVGTAYRLGDGFGLRLEWEVFDFDDADVNMISGGIEFRF